MSPIKSIPNSPGFHSYVKFLFRLGEGFSSQSQVQWAEQNKRKVLYHLLTHIVGSYTQHIMLSFSFLQQEVGSEDLQAA